MRCRLQKRRLSSSSLPVLTAMELANSWPCHGAGALAHTPAGAKQPALFGQTPRHAHEGYADAYGIAAGDPSARVALVCCADRDSWSGGRVRSSRHCGPQFSNTSPRRRPLTPASEPFNDGWKLTRTHYQRPASVAPKAALPGFLPHHGKKVWVEPAYISHGGRRVVVPTRTPEEVDACVPAAPRTKYRSDPARPRGQMGDVCTLGLRPKTQPFPPRTIQQHGVDSYQSQEAVRQQFGLWGPGCHGARARDQSFFPVGRVPRLFDRHLAGASFVDSSARARAAAASGPPQPQREGGSNDQGGSGSGGRSSRRSSQSRMAATPSQRSAVSARQAAKRPLWNLFQYTY
jgi:hypothetical protein